MPYNVNLLEIKEILSKELPLLTEKIPGLVKPSRYDGVTEYADSCMLLRISLYSLPYMRGKAKRAMLTELKQVFDRYNIQIPYNQIVVHYASEEKPVTPEELKEPEEQEESEELM